MTFGLVYPSILRNEVNLSVKTSGLYGELSSQWNNLSKSRFSVKTLSFDVAI